MTEQRLAGIEARAKAATEGPWSEEPGKRGLIVSGLMPDPECEGETVYDWSIATVAGPFCDGPTDLFDGTPNASFIAHAREDIPYLLTTLREAKSEALKAKALGFTDTAREWLMEAYGHRKAISMLASKA